MPGQDPVYDMPWPERWFTTCPDRDAVLQHTLVRTQFYDMHWVRTLFTTFPSVLLQSVIVSYVDCGDDGYVSDDSAC